MGAVSGGRELSGYREARGTALRLSNCIKETVSGLGSLRYVYVVQTPSVEGGIFVEQIRPTVALEKHEDIDILTFCCV